MFAPPLNFILFYVYTCVLQTVASVVWFGFVFWKFVFFLLCVFLFYFILEIVPFFSLFSTGRRRGGCAIFLQRCCGATVSLGPYRHRVVTTLHTHTPPIIWLINSGGGQLRAWVAVAQGQRNKKKERAHNPTPYHHFKKRKTASAHAVLPLFLFAVRLFWSRKGTRAQSQFSFNLILLLLLFSAVLSLLLLLNGISRWRIATAICATRWWSNNSQPTSCWCKRPSEDKKIAKDPERRSWKRWRQQGYWWTRVFVIDNDEPTTTQNVCTTTN